MRYLLILSLLLSVGCATARPRLLLYGAPDYPVVIKVGERCYFVEDLEKRGEELIEAELRKAPCPDADHQMPRRFP